MPIRVHARQPVDDGARVQNHGLDILIRRQLAVVAGAGQQLDHAQADAGVQRGRNLRALEVDQLAVADDLEMRRMGPHPGKIALSDPFQLAKWVMFQRRILRGDFSEALAALLGPNAHGLSAKTITRLKADWWNDYEAWQRRDLSHRRFLYIWADGVYFKPRMAEERQCVLVIVGADEYGHKELLAMIDGFRESAESWRELLLDLRRRGLKQDPKLAIGDGALGFWTALREVFATTREQRCWVHKTMNVLNALPKSLQDKAKGHLHDIWQAETKAGAGAAFDFFVETYGVKYDKAVAKLVKDREALLTFYDYPAEHWKHIRTSNPIESTFATVRHRTKRTKGCLSRRTGLAMAFKLMMSAQGKWRKLDGQNRLPEIIQGVEFRDGLRQLQVAA